MKVKVIVDINTAKILKDRKLGGDNKAQLHLADKVNAIVKPYVPFLTGYLQNSAVVSSDGSAITWPGPYAHYQYYGQVMAGRAPKRYTGDKLTYSGGGVRGPQWDKRMMADKSKELVSDLKKYIGG